MKKAFTLAEVLATLATIGIVAALTIPSVIKKYQEYQTVVKLKKTHSNLSQAFRIAVFNYGTIDTWGMKSNSYASGADAKIITDKIVPNLKVSKYCANTVGCWTNGITKYLNNINDNNIYNSTNRSKITLVDGKFLYVATWEKDCNLSLTSIENSKIKNVCGHATVDIDGEKGPNTWGKDIFSFYITKTGEIIPRGVPEATEDSVELCQLTGSSSYGCTCAAWVIYKGNLDYLKGKILSW